MQIWQQFLFRLVKKSHFGRNVENDGGWNRCLLFAKRQGFNQRNTFNLLRPIWKNYRKEFGFKDEVQIMDRR